MAKKTSKKISKKTTKKSGRSGGGRRSGVGYKAGDAKGRHIVIVESPSKARTINRYLGSEYLVLPSVGHVRDLPSKAPKGDKSPVPGVNLEKRFAPTYEVLPGKDHVIRDLKRAAKEARESGGEIWFATDKDREGEAIAWHLAEELGIEPDQAKRVIFAAITKDEIDQAFAEPHPIDEDRVNAQQARRILDRIVGYQVSPLLWKKVARGLSAGRVQSVAVRLVVEREREIRTFVPDEYWQIQGTFALSKDDASKLAPMWASFLDSGDEGQTPTQKAQNAWLGERGVVRAELVDIAGEKFDVRVPAEQVKDEADRDACDVTKKIGEVAAAAGLDRIEVDVEEDPEGRGPARWRRTVRGEIDASVPYRVASIETKRTTSRPSAPFITSTLQQAASTRLGFGAQRTMRAAQALYEGVDIPGEGPVGLITYMRTDSTHLSPSAVDSARTYIQKTYGDDYIPSKPNRYSSSNKDAQEAHEAIRPTALAYPPDRVKSALSSDQFRLYSLIWERFVACQMAPAQWDSTAVMIRGGRNGMDLGFRATGRVLVFDGFYRVTGVPVSADAANLPAFDEGQGMHPFWVGVDQKFTSPPPRYTEASLIRKLEEEGIGRPSTYASIIQVIQDRKYVEQIERRFHSTDLGEVVTDKLVEAFPAILDVGYTRDMEEELDKVEEEHLDWVEMLNRFYGPFRQSLDSAMENLAHAKAETFPAPKEYRCEKCGSDLVYRFGKNGRFLSCSTYPDCDYACPVDRHGRPRTAEFVDVACPKCGSPMTRRTGRFGTFLGCAKYNDETDPCDGILNLDKKGKTTAPSPPPLETTEACPRCGEPLYLRSGIRGPWLGCSAFPKCRGRGKWTELEDSKKADLTKRLEAHEREHPIPIIRTLSGRALTDERGRPLEEAPVAEALVLDADPRESATSGAGDQGSRPARSAGVGV